MKTENLLFEDLVYGFTWWRGFCDLTSRAEILLLVEEKKVDAEQIPPE